MRPIAILQHEADTPPCVIGYALEELDVPFEVRHLYLGDALPRFPEETSGLIVLGGSMHVHQKTQYPFLEAENRYLRSSSSRAPRSGGSAWARSFSPSRLAETSTAATCRRSDGCPSRSVSTTRCCTGSARRSSPSSGTCTPASCRLSASGRRARRRPPGVPRRRPCLGHPVPPEVDGHMVEQLDRSSRPRTSTTGCPAWPTDARGPSRRLGANEAFCRRLTTNFLLTSGLLPGHAGASGCSACCGAGRGVSVRQRPAPSMPNTTRR